MIVIKFIIQFLLLPIKVFPYLIIKFLSIDKLRAVRFTLKDTFDETPPTTGLAAMLRPDGLKFYDLVFFLNFIKNEIENKSALKHLKQITIKVHNPKLGWGKAWELHQAIQAIETRGVNVTAYLVSADLLSYYIALACSEIIVPPALSLELSGLRSESFFFKSLFDDLKIKPNFIHIGSFKSSSERFTRKNSSSFAKKQTKLLLDDIFQEIESSLLESRAYHENFKAKKLGKLQENIPLSPKQALGLGLIDGILYQDQLKQYIKKKQGWIREPKYHSLPRTIKLLRRKKKILFNLTKKKRIALLTAEGAIIDSKDPQPKAISLNDYATALNQIKKGNYAALLLRINSPGGSALVSDLLWQDLMGLKTGSYKHFEDQNSFLHTPNFETTEEPPKTTKPKKPKKKKCKSFEIVVSQSDVAASGGYYLSAITQSVFSSPLSITGSIGVIGGKFNIKGMLSKFGISTDGVAVGSNSQIYSATSDFTAKQKENIKKNMISMYDLFRNRISLGRGHKDKFLKKVGEGRVYSGKQAKQLGLVDHLGGVVPALEKLKTDLGLKSDDQVIVDVYPQIKTSLFDRASLLPRFLQKIKVLQELNKDQTLFLDDRWL